MSTFLDNQGFLFDKDNRISGVGVGALGNNQGMLTR
jgi:hypothetical protein